MISPILKVSDCCTFNRNLLIKYIFLLIVSLSFNGISCIQIQKPQLSHSINHLLNGQQYVKPSLSEVDLTTNTEIKTFFEPPSPLKNLTIKDSHGQLHSIPYPQHQSRLLLQCVIENCVYCIKINQTQMCIVCLFPQHPNAALDQCQTPTQQPQPSTNSTIRNCLSAQIMTLGIIKNQICTQCASGFRFLILQGECFPVKDLNDSNQIISYGDYYYLCQEGCKKCEPTTTIELCFACREGYSMIEGAYTCVKCKGECKNCIPEEPSVCLGCFYGWVLAEGKCINCSNENCSKCNPNNTIACTSCKSSFFLAGDTCLSCPQNCLSCRNNTVCLLCNNAYFLKNQTNSLTQCLKCIAGCYECQSISQCLKCYPGFYQSGDQCLTCKANCINCTSNGNCTKCLPGYDRFNGECVKPLSDCILMNYDGKCKVCKSLFDLSLDGKCVESNGFDANLVTIACKYGMFAQNYWCYSCPMIFPFCIQCNSRYCLKCQDGYFLRDEDYTCKKCTILGCKVCQSEFNCLQCVSGYFMVEDISLSGQLVSYGQCKACDENCKTCITQNNHCLECKQNYTLNIDRTCEKDHKLKFSLTLNTNMIDFQSKLTQIIEEILSFTASNDTTSDKIKITKVYSGSVIVEGYLHFESSQDLSRVSQRVTSAVKAGSSLAGILIITVSFNGQGPILPVDQPAKVGTILAISIPSGVGLVLVLILITVVLYKRYKKNDNEKKSDSTEGVIVEQQQNNMPQITAPVKRMNDLPTIIQQQSKVEVDAQIIDHGSHKGIQKTYQYL